MLTRFGDDLLGVLLKRCVCALGVFERGEEPFFVVGGLWHK